MMALDWLAVTKRGLATTRPSPSASSAESVTPKRRLCNGLKNVSVALAGSAPSAFAAGKLRLTFSEGEDKRTPNEEARLSNASTMRASINTCRCGTSTRAINCDTFSKRSSMSVTNNWLVLASAMALPLGLSNRAAAVVPEAPAA